MVVECLNAGDDVMEWFVTPTVNTEHSRNSQAVVVLLRSVGAADDATENREHVAVTEHEEQIHQHLKQLTHSCVQSKLSP